MIFQLASDWWSCRHIELMVAHLPIFLWSNADAFSKLLGESCWMILPGHCFVGTGGLNTSS